MAARSLAQVERQLALGPAQAVEHAARPAGPGVGSDAELAAGIRSGRFDPADATAPVRGAVVATLRVADPALLTDRYPPPDASQNPYGLTYHFFMADVVTTGEARDALHQIARSFDDGAGEPVYFGSHRRAQGVIVPVDVWEKLLEQAEDDVDAVLVRDRRVRDDGRRLTRSEITDVFDRLRAGRRT